MLRTVLVFFLIFLSWAGSSYSQVGFQESPSDSGKSTCLEREELTIALVDAKSTVPTPSLGLFFFRENPAVHCTAKVSDAIGGPYEHRESDVWQDISKCKTVWVKINDDHTVVEAKRLFDEVGHTFYELTTTQAVYLQQAVEYCQTALK